MLTVEELNEIQGLLHYLTNLKELKPNDIELVVSDGSVAAIVGMSVDGTYVLKGMPE